MTAAHITDGFSDNGLEAAYFDDSEKRLYLVQSKWVTGANKAPELGVAFILTIDRGMVCATRIRALAHLSG